MSECYLKLKERTEMQQTVVKVAMKNVDSLYRGYAMIENRKADGCMKITV